MGSPAVHRRMNYRATMSTALPDRPGDHGLADALAAQVRHHTNRFDLPALRAFLHATRKEAQLERSDDGLAILDHTEILVRIRAPLLVA